MVKLLILIFISCFCWESHAARSEYPTVWWDNVDKKTAKWWEVLPQEASKGEVVLSKRNELGILSNFAATPFQFEGKKYKSIEGFWQSLKYPENKKDIRYKAANWKHSRIEVEQMTAFKAKEAGSMASKIMKKNNINWVTYKSKKMTYKTSKKGEHYKLIKKIMWAKVLQNPSVKKILLKTKSLKLIPDHKVSKSAPPAWRYNIIWMEIRRELQKNNI